VSAALSASPVVAPRSALSARAPIPSAAPRTGYLRLAPRRRARAARTPFVVVVVALLGGGLLGLLALNTVLAQDAFRLHSLKTEGRELAVREQVLQREVEGLRTPEALAARASAMGMVPAGPPAFLRLSDGAVIGAPAPGEAPVEAPAGSGDTLAEPPAPVDPPAAEPAGAAR
jgi:cell division protein FtsB